MKTTFSRFLAVMLAVAMVLTCAISGFVLPVTAGDTQSTSENLLADFVLPQTEFAAGEKTSSMDTGVALEPGRYVYRFEAIGTRAFV
ncbi:MAG: hypothetical protein IJP14_02310, partial [Clostridia bacterium]|nr:hypothetical protein [Clostridia bacterium]